MNACCLLEHIGLLSALPQIAVVLCRACVVKQSEIKSTEGKVDVVESGDDFVDQFHNGAPDKFIDNVM